MGSAKAKRKERKIAIIGGGIAGLSAAWYLKKNGYKHVTLFEKENRVGGKIVSYDVDGLQHDVSAILLMGNYKEMFELADAVGATYSPGIQLNRYQADLDGGRYLFGREKLRHTGYPLHETASANARFLLRSFFKYRKFSSASNGLLHPPAELKQSTETFLRQFGFQPLIGAFSYGMTSLGYGRLDKIPATYLTKYIDWRGFISVASSLLLPGKAWPKTFDNGFHDFVQRVHDECVEMGVDIRLGTNVTSVERSTKTDVHDTEINIGTASPKKFGNYSPVGKNNDAQAAAEEKPTKKPDPYDELILSCQLDGVTLSKMGMKDLTPDEKLVFNGVYSQKFYALTCRTKNLPAGVMAVMPPPSERSFSLYVQQHPETGVTTFYIPAQFIVSTTNGSSGGGLAYENAIGENNAFEFEKKLGADGIAAGSTKDIHEEMKTEFLEIISDQLALMPTYNGGKPEILANSFIRTEEWNYFPRADLSWTARDMHEFVESMQGSLNTYYNSSFMSMEICGTTVAYCKHLIDQQFPE